MNEYVKQLAALYQEMEKAYGQVATLLDFSCTDCQDNCCDSYFLHHTNIEWAYLWQGFNELPKVKQKEYRARAKEYMAMSEKALAKEERPSHMCPVNDDGRCGLYSHRLMICRLHGVPASMTSPNGQKHSFPGCFRCQELTQNIANVTTMDRTLFFQKMVGLEKAFVGKANIPRVKLTLAEMLIKGAPSL